MNEVHKIKEYELGGNATQVANKAIDNSVPIMTKILNMLGNAGYNFLAITGQSGKVASAQRERHLLMAQTEQEVQEIRNGSAQFINGALISTTVSEPSNAHQGLLALETSVLVKEFNKQKRLQSIMEKVEECAKEESQVSDDPIDPDWFDEWVKTAEGIQKEELQLVWAQILVKEAAKPGTYSLRIFEFLKYLTPQEAKLIEKMAPFVLDGNVLLILNQRIRRIITGEFPQKYLNTGELIELAAMGLLTRDSMLTYIRSSHPADERYHWLLRGMNKGIYLEHAIKSTMVEVPSYPLTALGRNVISLLKNISTNEEYLYELGSALIAHYDGLSAQICGFRYEKDGCIHVENMKAVEVSISPPVVS